MNTTITTIFVITAIIAVTLVFAAGPLVATHQVWACGGWDGGCFTYGGWGTYTYGGFGFSSSGGFGGW
jgi:hypothetical protein